VLKLPLFIMRAALGAESHTTERLGSRGLALLEGAAHLHERLCLCKHASLPACTCASMHQVSSARPGPEVLTNFRPAPNIVRPCNLALAPA